MLEARSLTKYYDHTPAVRDVSFTIRPGEILGCLGPNGAGKSTTVKMLTGLIDPSEGQIFYQGRSVHDDFTAFQRRIGYVPEEAHLYPHLSGREYLQLVGRLRGHAAPGSRSPRWTSSSASSGCGTTAMRRCPPIRKACGRRSCSPAALLHNPEILILDEPFSGLDVTSAMMLRSLLRSLAGQGKMILYSSHVLEVVEKVCSNVMILRKGEVVAYDSISRLRELMSQPSLEGVFAQLAQVDDSDRVANRILEVMSLPQAEPEPARASATEVEPVLAARSARIRGGDCKGCPLWPAHPRGVSRLHRCRPALPHPGHRHRNVRLQRDERNGAAHPARRGASGGVGRAAVAGLLSGLQAISRPARCALGRAWPT